MSFHSAEILEQKDNMLKNLIKFIPFFGSSKEADIDYEDLDEKLLEENLQKHAIFSPDEIKIAPIEEIIDATKVKKIGMGQLGRVYRVLGSRWVFKESRWDLNMELVGNAKVPIPAKIAQRVLGAMFSFTFLPREKEVLRQYKMYLTFVQYFGYFKDKEAYFHPNRDAIFTSQQNIRSSLEYFIPEIEKKYRFKFNKNIHRVLNSKYKTHNFLPKEYQLYGESISPENKRQNTSFIFQEFMKGNLLYNYNTRMRTLPKRELYQLIILIYLIFLMHMQTNLLPDTRPRYVFIQAYDWLTKTDNIIVDDKRGLVFIDTRWFWDTKSNFVRRGLIIPEVAINTCKTTINRLLNYVE